MTSPTVSVIIPTFNSEKTVIRAIDSILAQTFKDFEIIVVDDGSTDNTRACLAAYAGQINYIYQENQERSAARNTGIRNARGSYIAFLDSDDYWLPAKLERQVAVLQARPELGMVHCSAYAVDEQEQPLYIMKASEDIDDTITAAFCRLLLGNFIISGTPLIRHSCIKQVGFFDLSMCQAEDWDYWLRVARQYPIAGLKEPLSYYTVTERNLLQKMAARNAQQDYPNILNKNRNSNECPETTFNLALALAWFRGALIDLGLGHIEEGQYRLQTALENEPRLLSAYYNEVLEAITDMAFQLCSHEESSKTGEDFIRSVCKELPPPANSVRQIKKTLGKFYAHRFFQGHWLENHRIVRTSLWPMITNKPQLLRNRGVWSIALHAFSA